MKKAPGRVDPNTLQRLDNSAVVDFLTSTASALADEGFITTKDIDGLRVVLSGIQSDSAARGEALLFELQKQHADFLALLVNRYGAEGLALNLMRHTLRSRLNETSTTLNRWGHELLQRSQLFFNRPLYVFVGNQCEREVLFSSALIDFSELLSEASDTMTSVQEILSHMVPSTMASLPNETDSLDTKIAQALGFKATRRQFFPRTHDQQALSQFSTTIRTLADSAMTLMEHLRRNAVIDRSSRVAVLCDWLAVECDRLSSTTFPDSDDLDVWEVRRQNLLLAVADINHTLKDLSEEFLAGLSRISQLTTFEAGIVPQDLLRRLAVELIKKHTSSVKAKEATTALARYCRDKRVSPRAIIAGELKKIHPSLDDTIFQLISTLVHETPLVGRAQDKSGMMRRSESLMNRFATKLTDSGTLLVLIGVLTAGFGAVGCGLKTATRSDIPDPRPEVPYRTSIVIDPDEAAKPPSSGTTLPQQAPAKKLTP